MRKARILGLAAAVAGSAVALTALVSACSTYDQPKAVAEAASQVPDNPDWNWHVRPILSQNCFGCHGSGTQKAGLRLDDEKVATGDLPENKGHRAIVPGNPGKSEIFKRILSSDPDFKMPPKDTHKTLTPLEIATLQKWVKQGAKYKPHWAYIVPKEVRPARTEWDKQAVNPIDRYIYAGLKTAGLSPSPEADKETLINRVTLDLTGLPPTLAEVDAFVADTSPNAYEKLVDRLLASRQYAERQTNIWLDVARYSDTRGGLFDQEASFQHPYRDWLISAFARNLPYDKFVTWQLAGDKLPNATREQILATGFLRAGKKDSEGGVIDEEYRVNYVNERAELMGKAFLGLTVGCAKCHNHKYDVISQADYYSMGGFFNSMEERGIYSGSGPMGATLAWPTPMQARNQAAAVKVTEAKTAAYQAALAAAKARAGAAVDRIPAAQRAAYLQQGIAGSTLLYYPFDSGYKGNFEELKYDPTPLGAGAPDPLGPEPKPPGGLTRQEWQLKLQNDILAEQRDRKLNPAKYAAADKAKAEAMKAALAKNGGEQLVDRRGRAVGPATGPKDPDAPRIARLEVDGALDAIAAKGFKDSRRADPQRVPKRDLPVGVYEKDLLWTPSGIPGAKPGAVHRVTFIPGAKGQAVQIHDSVVMAYPGSANFERTEAWTIDFWVKLRKKDYEQDSRPEGPQAVMLSNNGQANSPGYELGLDKGKLQFAIISNAPYNMIKIAGLKQMPRERWVHLTATYDGNSKAAGMHVYQDGKLLETEVVKDRLTGSTKARNSNSYFGGYYGLSAGTGFNRPEMVDGGYDELRVLNRALTPAEAALMHSQSSFSGLKPDEQRASLIEVVAEKDPAVIKARAELTAARLAQQKVEAPINQLLVAADTPKPRVNHILDRGIYNTYLEEVPTQALPRVYKWDKAKLPANRLGLAQWLFDPKHPLTSRVYVNRLWQSHFGTGIVQTVDDFGTQGTNPTNPELLDYLAIEFVRSGWDIKHMHKLMVMSATYRQASTVTPDRLEKDPRNFLLARGPRYRLSAEQLRDSALFVSALLVDKPGGDSVFPVQPDLIWEGVAQGFVVYPTDVPDDQNHRRSMYTFAKRNQGPANMLVFDASDRTQSVVQRVTSNTPLQALALMNDPQFLETYRKLAERSIKSTANTDQQLVTLFRLGARRHPTDRELAAMRKFRADEVARASKNPAEAAKLLKVGNAPVDTSIDPAQLSAMTVVAAGVMNSPAAYTLR